MSDFIKVNYENGHIHIINKLFLHFEKVHDEIFAYDTLFMVTGATIHSEERMFHFIENNKISQEEYDRLCKKLGIE